MPNEVGPNVSDWFPAPSGQRETAPCDVIACVINYRSPELTIACARSLLEDLAGMDAEVVVVDNFSNDGSANQIAAWIEQLDPDTPIRLMRSKLNRGFSGGHNLGFAYKPARYYFVLNSDAVVRSGTLRVLVERAEADPDVGVVGPQLEYDDGRVQTSCFRFPSPWSELIRGAASGPVTSAFRNHLVPLKIPPDPETIEWVSFAAALLRAEMIAQIGFMDEGYFLYFEDAEYCLRAQRAGWRVAYEPSARVVHHRGGSSPVKALAKRHERLPAYYYASRTRFLHAAYGWSGLLAANLLWHAGRAIARLRVLFGRSVPLAAAGEAADIWINFLDPRGDHRTLKE